MSEKELLFYKEYEQFYTMAVKSKVFGGFCEKAFGEDFSQDGFSDMKQINRIMEYMPKKGDVHILDIGCGNGKMLGYLQKNTDAYIYGFDYSNHAIQLARELFPYKSEFKIGIIGETEYPKKSFDMVISMDTMYFAKDMAHFLAQIWGWLREGGVFFCGYQEGDVMPKTDNKDTTELAKAFRKNGIDYEVENITEECYDLLRRKRESAIYYEREFFEAGEEQWYHMLMGQTECARKTLGEFSEEMARYIYVVKRDDF